VVRRNRHGPGKLVIVRSKDAKRCGAEWVQTRFPVYSSFEASSPREIRAVSPSHWDWRPVVAPGNPRPRARRPQPTPSRTDRTPALLIEIPPWTCRAPTDQDLIVLKIFIIALYYLNIMSSHDLGVPRARGPSTTR
jgi:hypothetical protein